MRSPWQHFSAAWRWLSCQQFLASGRMLPQVQYMAMIWQYMAMIQYMAMMPFFMRIFTLQVAAACFQCDQRFLESVGTELKEILPEDVPNRDGLMEHHIQDLADIHGTFLRKKYERVLDVRGVKALKNEILNFLHDMKNKTWKGVFIWQLSMVQYKVALRKRMQETLEKFADLACSEDCTVSEGPVLDCWSCMRIVAQCFDGELCGVEERHLAEYKEIVLYIFLVCESVLVTSIILVYLVCFKHKKMMLRKSLGL